MVSTTDWRSAIRSTMLLSMSSRRLRKPSNSLGVSAGLFDIGFAKLEFAHLQDAFETGLKMQGAVTDLLSIDTHTTLFDHPECVGIARSQAALGQCVGNSDTLLTSIQCFFRYIIRHRPATKARDKRLTGHPGSLAIMEA